MTRIRYRCKPVKQPLIQGRKAQVAHQHNSHLTKCGAVPNIEANASNAISMTRAAQDDAASAKATGGPSVLPSRGEKGGALVDCVEAFARKAASPNACAMAAPAPRAIDSLQTT
jgi:hypothetical protein